MASKVVFAPFEDGAPEDVVREKIIHAFEAADLASAVPADRPVAVKTHFGERGNNTYIPPSCVRAVVELVRRAGGKPCLVETSTLYRGQRHNAVDHFNLAVAHGFGPEQMGCPLIFLDGLLGHLHVEVEVGLKHCRTVAVAGDLVHMPGAIIVTHLTGHMLAGLGGAIKNVAMGLSSRPGKLRQHSDGQPRVDEGTCVACGACARWCPEDAIEVTDAAAIDRAKCVGCGECVAVCPVGAVQFSWSAEPQVFNEKMAEYTYGCLKDKLGNTGFVTVVNRVTRDCNCMGGQDEIISADLGVLASCDPVAIDQAAADLVNEAHGGDLFEETWPGKHYTAQFEHGEAIGLGSREYELVRL
jgi:uncharacterized Fe-S center protein